jgi:hypothetical protein
MALPPATQFGQHTRNGTGMPMQTSQKVQKVGPLKRLLGKLNLRERIMIITLLIIAVIAIVVFLVVLPAFERVTALEDEIELLQAEKSGIHVEPDRVPEYQHEYEVALRDYENYQRFYYPFMDPEVIDKTITDLLLNNCLEPIRLAMTPVGSATLPLYSASRTLVPRPVPATEKPDASDPASDDEGADGANGGAGADGAGDGNGSGNGASDGADTENGNSAQEQQSQATQLAASTDDPASDVLGADTNASNTGGTPDADGDNPAGGSLIYCYTIDVEAIGWMRDFFSFLEAARGITAMEIVSYSYDDPQDPSTTTNRTKTADETQTEYEEPKGGTIIMQIKLYVFIDDSMTTSDLTSD